MPDIAIITAQKAKVYDQHNATCKNTKAKYAINIA